MVYLLNLLLGLLFFFLPIFCFAEQAGATYNVSSTKIIALQTSTAVREQKTSTSGRSGFNYSNNKKINSKADLDLPRFEAYDPTIIEDGYKTGKRVGFWAGINLKHYSCNNFDFNCSVNKRR
jgi:hypothetical protein